MESSLSPFLLSCLAPGKGRTHCHSWQDTAGTNVSLFCRHKDGVGPSSQPLWLAEGRVIPALVSSLGLCSLKSSTELRGSGYSSIAGAITTRNSFTAKHLKWNGPELCFVSPAKLCAPFPAGSCVNGTLLALVSTLSSRQSRWLCLQQLLAPACPVRWPGDSSDSMWDSLKDLGASVVSSCPSEMPPQQGGRTVGIAVTATVLHHRGRICNGKMVWFLEVLFGFFSSEMDNPLKVETCTNYSLGFPPGKMESWAQFHTGSGGETCWQHIFLCARGSITF